MFAYFGETPIHYAAESGNPVIVEMLVTMGGSPKILDTEKQSPLHIACEMGNLDVVKLLLTYGLSTTTKDVNGFTAYDYAKKNEYQDILDELTKNDADKDDTIETTPETETNQE